ncbi:sugar ABC transporter ATP-binding protein [Demequina sp. SYSU T00068]|uniref:sugar ABC transporter ATP-binding protein n=1 Tax=Demequina lignilytica TaxID=3051663 RepID=UPI0026309B1A|nr:sugar ABC transporter ATP-binding protein [Demequina sp. SYSU T00068]MDN4490687.1 sugar ABC transporter ATP-binding protein [Demequina sp. SYSU T00068]
MTEAAIRTLARGEIVMRAEQITKAYGGTHALRGVDFELRVGEVTALIGENGAGKSTLMKILSGVETPSSGSIVLDGAEVSFASPTEALAQGVAIIHQELNLCPNLSIADNVFLGREKLKGGSVDFAAQRRETAELMERLEEQLDPRTLVGDLRVGQQQIIEIARALSEDARILIMDEPTSALSHAEVEVLFRMIRELTARGVSIVYISHHLDECLEIADTAVVLRDGEIVARADMEDVDLGWIVSQMVGREQSDLYAPMAHDPGEVLLSIEGLVVSDPDSPGRLAARDVTFDVHSGEVVGIYGLMGAGRTELLEAIAGRNPISAGSVTLDGEELTHRTVQDRIDRGLILVPEDRQRDGLVQTLGVGRNMALASVGRFLKAGLLDQRAEKEHLDTTAKGVKVKMAGLDAAIGSLSGGNQQKVVIGKALLTEPRVVVLDEPTRGIDVGAKADIFALMASQAREGRAVLFATSEVGEVLYACDRILVMSRGRIVAELDPRTTTREKLMAVADSGSAAQTTNEA